ncbi:hypothetical protein [Conexibacter woesei]|uniref:Uncharacterized protein n=1 Tax=Conexibacter woesei (strain DSM 14684 / CCUG 47730 / CIP 108061 / JCM 11494 / NBRC 100937 / ID131577) TaxID=469383 RepID=D3F6N3_CONWI|nr:hypothetical protein [Conexibacter woesei]ADB50800.1 hypothetical protein Cwoe_2376 [Conexibacter woesei DSM 14684]
MGAPTASAPAPQGSRPLQQPAGFGIAAVAAVLLLTSCWMLLAPRGFHASVGAFGAYNAHYLHDAMALNAGVGVALALAVRWPSLRAGALTAATACIGFHAINHWFDLGNDEPGSYAGAIGALSQTSLAVVCGVLLWIVVRERAA